MPVHSPRIKIRKRSIATRFVHAALAIAFVIPLSILVGAVHSNAAVVTGSTIQLAPPSAHQRATTCAPGETLLAPTSETIDQFGVRHFTYGSVRGMESTLPPAHITSAQITPAITADLRLPTRGIPRAEIARQVLSLASLKTAPLLCKSHTVIGRPADVTKSASGKRSTSSPGVKFAHVYSGDWGGYAVTEAENGGGMNGAIGTWTQGQSLDTVAPSIEGTWVGIGGGLGEGSDVWGLIQAGTSMQTNEGYRSWYEYVDGVGDSTGCCGAIYNGVNSVRPGDTITSEVYWVSSTQACFAIIDYTRSSGDIDECPSISTTYDHTSVEWVNEYPPGAQSSYYYDNPSTTDFTGQYYWNSFDLDGTAKDPFSGSFEAVIQEYESTSGTNCSDAGVLGYPAAAAATSDGGKSDIITCWVSGVDD
jgi:hypothetical protein